MGYYTRFELKADRDGDGIIEALTEAGVGPFDKEDNTWRSEDRWKWYEWKEDMQAVSKQFPLALITLRGYGEESGDIWQAYFVAGAVEVHKLEVVFPPPQLVKPRQQYATVEVTVMGVDIPVEIEYTGAKTKEELYAMAKEQLRRML